MTAWGLLPCEDDVVDGPYAQIAAVRRWLGERVDPLLTFKIGFAAREETQEAVAGAHQQHTLSVCSIALRSSPAVQKIKESGQAQWAAFARLSGECRVCKGPLGARGRLAA
jgi:hypothetical protein